MQGSNKTNPFLLNSATIHYKYTLQAQYQVIKQSTQQTISISLPLHFRILGVFGVFESELVARFLGCSRALQ
jgi:hypothetical protein